MYTALVLHPRDKEWGADGDFIFNVFGYFNIQCCETVWGYTKPLLWNKQSDESLDKRDISIADSVKLFTDKKSNAFIYFIESDAFSNDICAELEGQTVVDCYEDYVPCEIAVYVGKQSIGDIWLEKTYAEFNFSIRLGGDGMPKDLLAYLEKVFKPAKSVQTLMAFLKEKSGIDWTVSYSCSY